MHKWHIAIRDLERMVLHGIAAYRNGIFYRIFLHVISCEFSLRTSVNFTENLAELFAHTQTRYQVLLSNFFKRLGMRLVCVCQCVNVLTALCSLTTPSCTMCGRWGGCVCGCVSVSVCANLGLEQVGNFPCELIG